MDFDWDDAKAFLVTAETGSLTAAAKQLRTSQPTVGRRVTALEESLGVVLFERSRNSLFLTPQGKRIFEALEGMEKVANNTILVAKSATESIAGTVTIAVSQVDACFKMPGVIAELRQREPTLQIKLEVSNNSADLVHRNADIAIRNYRPTEENLIIRKLGDAQVSLFGTPELCEAYRVPKDGKHELPIIGFFETEYLTQILVEGGIPKAQINYTCLSDFQLSHIELAKRGMGFALLPTNLSSEFSELECVLPEDQSVYDYSIWLVCHSELRHNQRIRYVYDFLVERLCY